jgi:hypothetical protein
MEDEGYYDTFRRRTEHKVTYEPQPQREPEPDTQTDMVYDRYVRDDEGVKIWVQGGYQAGVGLATITLLTYCLLFLSCNAMQANAFDDTTLLYYS